MLQLTFLLLGKHLIKKTQNHEVYSVNSLSTVWIRKQTSVMHSL